MYCGQCGVAVGGADRFCNECGHASVALRDGGVSTNERAVAPVARRSEAASSNATVTTVASAGATLQFLAGKTPIEKQLLWARVTAAGGGLLGLGAFLPWASFDGTYVNAHRSVSGLSQEMNHYGLWGLVLGGLLIAWGCIYQTKRPVMQHSWALAGGIGAALILLAAITRVDDITKYFDGYGTASSSFGWWVSGIGAAGAITGVSAMMRLRPAIMEP
jgi:hypothetical protein